VVSKADGGVRLGFIHLKLSTIDAILILNAFESGWREVIATFFILAQPLSGEDLAISQVFKAAKDGAKEGPISMSRNCEKWSVERMSVNATNSMCPGGELSLRSRARSVSMEGKRSNSSETIWLLNAPESVNFCTPSKGIYELFKASYSLACCSGTKT